MKTKYGVSLLVVSAVSLVTTGCEVGFVERDGYHRHYYGPAMEVYVAPAPPPVVYVQPPPLPPPVVVIQPESYFFDGVEYIGVVGDRYYWLDGNVWVVCGPEHLDRVHVWIGHWGRDWRSHSFRYERGRGPEHGPGRLDRRRH